MIKKKKENIKQVKLEKTKPEKENGRKITDITSEELREDFEAELYNYDKI